MPDVHGFVAAGFDVVAEEFERNFAERGELGAAFAAVRDGEPVVDLWGGVADRAAGRAWREDTLQVIFSGTKGLVAVCVLIAIERGLLELEAPVARYWPEFGKEDIRVRDVVSHTARLPGIDEPVGIDQFADAALMTRLLERQAPSEDPRASLCYHAFTYGWLCGELIRRVDGRPIGRFFAEEVAAPLELELWIGLPDEYETRVSTIEVASRLAEHSRAETRDACARRPRAVGLGEPTGLRSGCVPLEQPRLSRRGDPRGRRDRDGALDRAAVRQPRPRAGSGDARARSDAACRRLGRAARSPAPVRRRLRAPARRDRALVRRRMRSATAARAGRRTEPGPRTASAFRTR